MIAMVYFDYGGVLTEGGKKGFIGQTLGRLYGVPPETLDIADLHLMLRRGKGSERLLFDRLNQRYGKQVTKEMFLAATEFVVPSQEVYDLAARLRAHGIQTGILSNVFAMNVPDLKQRGAYEGFAPLILSCEVGYAKPDPEIYQLAIAEAGVAPNEIVFVDDQDKCLPPAEAAGMQVVQAITPEQTVRDVTALIAAQNGIVL